MVSAAAVVERTKLVNALGAHHSLRGALTNRGRLDMAVRAGGRIYLFEFKVIEQSGPGRRWRS